MVKYKPVTLAINEDTGELVVLVKDSETRKETKYKKVGIVRMAPEAENGK